MNGVARASAASRIVLFVVAAAVRLSLSALFYGSVDVTNDILDANKIFKGLGPYLAVPYFPGVQLFLWIGGLLVLHTSLPVGLAFKIFPSLFDAGTAVLLTDFGPTGRAALRRAYLYAVAPVPLLITCIHGQWDAVMLFFLLLAVWAARLGSESGDVAAGLAYTLSIVVKPVAAPLLLFFLPARRVLISIVAAMACYAAVVQWIGYPLTLDTFQWIAKYANSGVQLIGLPELLPIPRWRVSGLIPLVPLLWLFWKHRISRERAFFLFFVAVIGCCGVGPQYLLWAVPFAIAAGEIRFTAVYNLLCLIALLCYYQSPGTGGRNIENFGALAPLKRFAWLSPPPGYAQLKELVVLYAADLAIPLLCVGAFVAGVVRAIRRPELERHVAPAPRAMAALATALAGIVLISAAWAWTMPPVPKGTAVLATVPPLKKDVFVIAAVRKTLAQYDVVLYSGPGLVQPQNPALLARSLVAERRDNMPRPLR